MSCVFEGINLVLPSHKTKFRVALGIGRELALVFVHIAILSVFSGNNGATFWVTAEAGLCIIRLPRPFLRYHMADVPTDGEAQSRSGVGRDRRWKHYLIYDTVVFHLTVMLWCWGCVLGLEFLTSLAPSRRGDVVGWVVVGEVVAGFICGWLVGMMYVSKYLLTGRVDWKILYCPMIAEEDNDEAEGNDGTAVIGGTVSQPLNIVIPAMIPVCPATPAISPEELASLKILTFKPASSSSPTSTSTFLPPLHSTDETCAICISPYEPGDTLRELACHHRFHIACIDPWLVGKQPPPGEGPTDPGHRQCPLCKQDAILTHPPVSHPRVQPASPPTIPIRVMSVIESVNTAVALAESDAADHAGDTSAEGGSRRVSTLPLAAQRMEALLVKFNRMSRASRYWSGRLERRLGEDAGIARASVGRMQ